MKSSSDVAAKAAPASKASQSVRLSQTRLALYAVQFLGLVLLLPLPIHTPATLIILVLLLATAGQVWLDSAIRKAAQPALTIEGAGDPGDGRTARDRAARREDPKF